MVSHMVFIISVLLSLILMKKYEEDYVYVIVATLIIFGFLRFIGVGG